MIPFATSEEAAPSRSSVAAPSGGVGTAHLHAALDAAGVGTWVWHIAENQIVWDAMMHRLFGVKPADVARDLAFVNALIHPDDREMLHAATARHAQSGAEFNFEYRIIRPNDGETRYIRSRGKGVRNEDGEVVEMIGTSWDITERKNLENELAQERFLLRSLMENLPEKIYFKDQKSRFIRVNSMIAQSFGAKTTTEVIGKTDFDYFTPEHASQAFSDEQRIMTTAEPKLAYEERETWPDGRTTWAMTTKLPLRAPSGEIVGTFGISRDVTGKRRAEEELARYVDELRHRNEELEEDLEMARELQQALMPRHYPAFNNGSVAAGSALRFSHYFNASTTVGGDFFDIIKLSETAAGVFVCDVMGHGVRAALVAAIIRALISELQNYADNPGEFLSRLNWKLYGILHQSGIPMFASASYVVADAESMELRFANAGHPEPLWIRKGQSRSGAHPLHQCTRGPVMGMFEDASYGSSKDRIAPHDIILQFTDGLFEVENTEGVAFDEKRLARVAGKCSGMDAAGLCKAVLAEVRQFSDKKNFDDDVCMVAMEINHLIS